MREEGPFLVFVGGGGRGGGKARCMSAHQRQLSVYKVESLDRISSLTPGEMHAIPALRIP